MYYTNEEKRYLYEKWCRDCPSVHICLSFEQCSIKNLIFISPKGEMDSRIPQYPAMRKVILMERGEDEWLKK